MSQSTKFDHINWRRKFQSLKMDGFREMRAEIFQDTIERVMDGEYNIGGKRVQIDNDVISEYFYKPEKLQKEKIGSSKITVVNADCLETAKLMLNAGLSPCVLNLASRQNPGGGVMHGSGAQEENLFRRSNLFRSLYQYAGYAESYGLKKSEHQYPLDRNTGGAYSGNITVFRSGEKAGYCLLNSPYIISFVTVAALNHPGLIKLNDLYWLADEYIEPTKERMRTIFRIAGKYNHDCLVLGAFGCGAFANPPKHIAKLFKDVLSEDEFINVFKHIIFSIFDDHNSRKEHNPEGNFIPFFDVFNEI